jgi:hypothetical protein
LGSFAAAIGQPAIRAAFCFNRLRRSRVLASFGADAGRSGGCGVSSSRFSSTESLASCDAVRWRSPRACRRSEGRGVGFVWREITGLLLPIASTFSTAWQGVGFVWREITGLLAPSLQSFDGRAGHGRTATAEALPRSRC